MAWWRKIFPNLAAPTRRHHGPLITAEDRAKLEFLRLQTGAFLALTRDGARMGPRSGGMVEFHGHQTYVPGMDIRGLDWSVYARNRQWMVRQYAREAAAHIHIYVDASASMGFDLTARAGNEMRLTTKYRQAARLAAMVACIALNGQDRVSLYLAGARDDQPELLSLRGLNGLQQLPALLQLLDSVEPTGIVRDRDMIRSILGAQPERGAFVWITDALDAGLLTAETAATGSLTRTPLEECLGWLSQQIGRVWFMQVQSERDWWADGGRLELVDAENGQVQSINLGSGARETLAQAAHSHSRQLEATVHGFGGAFLSVRDREDPFENLYRSLA